MANFDEMAILFAINNVEDHEHLLTNERQTRIPEMISDPFLLTDRLFIKNFRLSKNLVRNLIELLQTRIVSKNRSSAIDLNTKVSGYNI